MLLGNIEGHFWGTWRGAFGEYGGALFLRAFERKKLSREIFVWISRYEKCPVNRYLSPQGALMGNLERVRLLGLLREKKKYIWVPFLDPEGINILILGVI